MIFLNNKIQFKVKSLDKSIVYLIINKIMRDNPYIVSFNLDNDNPLNHEYSDYSYTLDFLMLVNKFSEVDDFVELFEHNLNNYMKKYEGFLIMGTISMTGCNKWEIDNDLLKEFNNNSE